MRDEMILLRLRSDDLVQGAVLIEKEVRVPIGEHPGTLGRQHKQLIAATRYSERSASIASVAMQVTHGIHFLLPSLIKFSGYVLVALII